MKEILMFYLTGCPYCAGARRAIEALKEEEKYADITVNMVTESALPEIAEQYDYYYVPTMAADGKKLYEAHPGESYEEILAHVREVFDTVLTEA